MRLLLLEAPQPRSLATRNLCEWPLWVLLPTSRRRLLATNLVRLLLEVLQEKVVYHQYEVFQTLLFTRNMLGDGESISILKEA